MIGQIKSSSGYDSSTLDNVPLNRQSEDLLAAYNSLPVISTEKLSSAFQVLDACAGYELLKTQLRDYKKSIDAQIDRYIRNNLTAPLSVSLLCSEFHLSKYELYDMCTKYFGCPPAEYIKKCRLECACEALIKTSLPINQIAIRCGIPDYNYFSKVFKSAFGVSPSEYKRNQKSEIF